MAFLASSSLLAMAMVEPAIWSWRGSVTWLRGQKSCLGCFSNGTHGTDGFGAGLAKGVDFVPDVLLAVGYPLHLDFSLQRIMKRDQLVI